MPSNCTKCGESLFSALERTRGVCASCFLSYKPDPKADAIGGSSPSRPEPSQPGEADAGPPEMSASDQAGEETL